jgi:N12 class adenine-specific DNA methylase
MKSNKGGYNMPVVKQSLEERLERLVERCNYDRTPITLFFDPTDGQWHGALDDLTGHIAGSLVAEEHSGDFDDVLEALEAELEL